MRRRSVDENSVTENSAKQKSVTENSAEQESVAESGIVDSDATTLVDETLAAAADCGASDVHFNPHPDHWEIWFRVDGVLVRRGRHRRDGPTDPVNRLMALAGVPVHHAARPREATLIHAGEAMRLAIFPTVHGIRAVVRRLENRLRPRTIAALGIPKFESFGDVEDHLADIAGRADGLVLLIGPSGSGKTTTLYAMLAEITRHQKSPRSVLAIEDPVESLVPGVNQGGIDASMSLADAMRAAVRQDADVLSVSEIRDADTAAAVADAAMTGHLTFSSMHAPTVGVALRRWVQMGVPVHTIAGSMSAIINMRLIRRRDGQGYRGRFPLFEIVDFRPRSGPVWSARPNDQAATTSTAEAMLSALESGRSATEIDAAGWAAHQDAADDIEPHRTLSGAARAAIDAGLTDAPEIRRVLGGVDG